MITGHGAYAARCHPIFKKITQQLNKQAMVTQLSNINTLKFISITQKQLAYA